MVSIIVVAFRDRDEVAALIDNIAPFRGSDLEFIIIDGGSDDGTLELLQARTGKVDYWMSEPDRGIYDAMNKGLDAANGKYILHLNAGDRLRMIPWVELRQCAANEIDVVCCRVLVDDSVEYVSKTGFLSRIDNTWHHQGTFYRKAAHLGYNETYRTGGDFDHNQRLLLAKCTVANLGSIVATHRNDGITSNFSSHEEIYRSIRANFGWLYLIPAMVRFRLLSLRSWLSGKRAGTTCKG